MKYCIASRNIEKETIINRSRFITYLFRCGDAGEVKPHISDLKKEHYKASHVCYAYYFGDQAAPDCGSNDDGEPKGTAGKPILEAIIQKEARSLLIAVVRYFGGVKLGAGGLIRAYHGCAVEALNEAGLVPDVKYEESLYEITYDKYDIFKNHCREQDYCISNEDFAETVLVTITHEEGESPEFPYGMVK